MNSLDHTVEEADSGGIRIDRYISDVLRLFSRSQVKIRVKKVVVNDKEVKISKKLRSGDRLSIFYSDPPPVDLIPEKMDLTILFEDEQILVMDKPQGVVVHPGSGNRTGTLINGIIWYCEEIKNNFSDMPIRPGIVHRLDKETSGLILVAKNPRALEFIGNQFRKRKVKKVYAAIVKGTPPEQEGIIETFIARDPHHRRRFMCTKRRGKKAITSYTLKRELGGYSLVALKPSTGRTHQLRVHMKYINCPIVGDELYGRSDQHFPSMRMMLHAYSIALKIPFEKKITRFKSPLPERFRKAILEIKKLMLSNN
jgi:23S rRNA pseudouridine1911/1915/1917 synthase